jgi:hypothetical protein
LTLTCELYSKSRIETKGTLNKNYSFYDLNSPNDETAGSTDFGILAAFSSSDILEPLEGHLGLHALNPI